MRSALLTIGLMTALAASAWADEATPVYHMLRSDFDYGHAQGEDIYSWDGEGFVGGDDDRLWVKSEGEVRGGQTTDAELQALWSHNIAPFWDTQAGLRIDIEPDTRAYLALGVQGLAPHGFETEATLFARDDGDLSARFKQSLDILFTQRLILAPHIEFNAYAQDDRERNIGAGIANVNGGLQLRYEITREFAPYLDLTIERALGETAGLVRRTGEDPEESVLRAGVRLWF